VIRDDDQRTGAKVVEVSGDVFGGLDFDVNGLRSGGCGFAENPDLFLNAAVVAAVVLVAAAGG
jgi:hypothetical protein